MLRTRIAPPALTVLAITVFLLVNTDTSLRIFVIALCTWLFLTGGVAVVIALLLRSATRSSADVKAVPPGAAASGPSRS